MVDPLNNANRQSLPIEVASSLRRLEAMLGQGQTRTAQVVQVTPQPMTATATPAAPTQASAAPPTSTALPANATPPANTAATVQPGSPQASTPAANPATVQTPVAAGTATGSPQAPTAAELFRVKVRLEGRLFDLITQKPLPPGSDVQISRDGSNRISLQLAPPAGQLAQPNPAMAKAATATPGPGSSGSPTAANPGSSTTLSSALSSTLNPAAQARAIQGANTPAQQLLQPGQRAATAEAGNNPATTNQAAKPGANSGQTTQPPAPQPTAQTARPVTAGTLPVERIAVQSMKLELPIGAGQRVSAEVISSRPNPAVQSTANPATASAPPQSRTSTALSTASQPVTPNTASQGANSQLIRLSAQGQRVELVSPRPLTAGTELQLVRDSKGQLWAELPTAKTQAIEQVLREHLPQQQSPAPLLNLLNQSQASGQLQQAKPLLLNLINLLTGRSLGSPQQTNAESVRQQVQNSGTLLESKLAQGDTRNLGQDHKALLLRLAHQLGQPSTQTELSKGLSEQISQHTQQALSRVLVNQITSSLGGQAQDTGTEANRTLALDIPVVWQNKTENLELKIQRDASGTDEETGEMEYRWRIRLNFQIDQDRLLEAELTLEQNRVSVIWSGDSSLRDQVERKLDQLQQRLEEIGLEVQTLGVRDSLPGTDATLKAPRNQLIDIKT